MGNTVLYWAQNCLDHQTIQITRVWIAEGPPYAQQNKSAIKCCIPELAQG